MGVGLVERLNAYTGTRADFVEESTAFRWRQAATCSGVCGMKRTVEAGAVLPEVPAARAARYSLAARHSLRAVRLLGEASGTSSSRMIGMSSLISGIRQAASLVSNATFGADSLSQSRISFPAAPPSSVEASPRKLSTGR